jgi:COP9 signalosome complex subunit 4
MDDLAGLEGNALTSKVQEITQNSLQSGNMTTISDLMSKLLSSSLQSKAGKLFVEMAKIMINLPESKDAIFEEAAGIVLSTINEHPNKTIFDEADYIIREALFAMCVRQGRFRDGAIFLSQVNFDSNTRTFTDSEKVDAFIKCAEACLGEDESVDADVFCNKAASLINSVSGRSLHLRYKVVHARVLDSNRKFIDAAVKYYDVSKEAETDVDAGELLVLLGKAVTCAILGRSGPLRARIMGMLSKDERVNSLDQLDGMASHPTVLHKMYNLELLKSEDLKIFEASLMDHQKAVASDGYTILQKAVIEHNVLAASKIYDNIRLEELGFILKLDSHVAEKAAAKMISDGRLKATIDQMDGILEFYEDSDPLISWDETIANLCAEIMATDSLGEES